MRPSMGRRRVESLRDLPGGHKATQMANPDRRATRCVTARQARARSPHLAVSWRLRFVASARAAMMWG